MSGRTAGRVVGCSWAFGEGDGRGGEGEDAHGFRCACLLHVLCVLCRCCDPVNVANNISFVEM